MTFMVMGRGSGAATALPLSTHFAGLESTEKTPVKMEKFKLIIAKAVHRHEILESLLVQILSWSRVYGPLRYKMERYLRLTNPRRRKSGTTGRQQEELKLQQDGWKWRQLPALPSHFVRLHRLVSYYLVYTLIKNLFIDQLLELIGSLGPSRPAHCYLPGRLVLHPSIERYFIILAGSYHFVWRFVVLKSIKPHASDALIYMMVCDSDLAKFSALLERHNSADVPIQKVKLPIGGAACLRREQCGNQSLRSNSDLSSTSENSLVEDSQLSELARHRELLFRHILCYKCNREPGSREPHHRLRPNRTMAARKLLRRYIVKGLMSCALVLIIYGLTQTLWVIVNLVSDQRYSLVYPGCEPQLGQAQRASIPWWQPNYSFTPHQRLTLVADALENLIIMGNLMPAVVSLWFVSYLLNGDLCIYYRLLDRKLRALEQRVRTGRRQWNQMGSPSEETQPELDAAVRELQLELHDFFQQIKAVDSLMSNLISVNLFLWLIFTSALGHLSLRYINKHDKLDLVLFMIGVQLLSLIFVCVGSSMILELNSGCQRSYLTLCSLMAYYQGQYKRKFLKLLEFYTIKRGPCYTLLHQLPYTKASFLSIFAWGVSCFFISDGLLRHRPG